MAQLTIVADIKAKPEHVELVKGELLKLTEPTRAEVGCVQYDLHQDNENPSHFLFFENWESRELWQDHMGSEHLAAFKAAAGEALEGITIAEMTLIA